VADGVSNESEIVMGRIASLRAFIDELDAIGEIQAIDAEVDWNLEIGAIIRRSYDLRAPAPLFNAITGYLGTGFRVLGAPGALSGPDHPLARIALALGLPPRTPGTEIMEAIVAARERPGIPPVLVASADAACKENILRGERVDLYTFPTPLIHGNDGGRYIQTYGMNIARTPDGTWTNWSINRMMIAGKDRLACLIPAPQHLGVIRSQWTALGKPMPIALALGVEPGLPFVGSMPLPEGIDESHFLGALLGEPIEVVRAETVELDVPASAEIVIEGEIAFEETVMEGPFNEYPGYNSHEASPKALFRVTAITHRDNAILPVVAAGPPVEEDHTGIGTMFGGEILYQLRTAGLPVSSVWFTFESAAHWLVISVRAGWYEELQIHSGELAKRIGDVAFAGKAAFDVPKILLVEDDIDITDVREVVWAFATRAHPEHGEVHFANLPTEQLSVYLSPEEAHSYRSGKVIHNCLLADRFSPQDRPVKGSFENGWPPEIQRRVLDRWSQYGYGAVSA
jgi:UbiD family decarboxylase